MDQFARTAKSEDSQRFKSRLQNGIGNGFTQGNGWTIATKIT